MFMLIRLLGPLRLAGFTGPIAITAPKERAIVAALALQTNRTVPEATLVEVLWGESPPRTAPNALQSHIARLRRKLASEAPHLAIETRGGGYALVGPAEGLDVAVADRMRAEAVEAAAAEDHEEVIRLASAGLDLWEGEPLAEFAGDEWALGPTKRLEDVRLELIELRIDAALALGRHRTVTADLEDLTGRYPYHEGLWARRIVALYRSGRQAEALRAYEQVRRELLETLGVDPGPELQALHQAVLGQSEDVAAPPPRPPSVPVAPANAPILRFAVSGDAHIAYRVDGQGDLDVVVLSGGILPIDSLTEEPRLAAAIELLGRRARVIHFDRRGVGISDSTSTGSPPTLEEWVEDAIAVLDAADSPAPAVLGWADGGLLALTLAATHPDRVARLVLIQAFPRFTPTNDYPWGQSFEQQPIEDVTDAILSPAAPSPFDLLGLIAPSLAEDAAFRSWWDRAGYRGASPAMAMALRRVVESADVRHHLESVRAPTLIIQRPDALATDPAHGRYLAARIPDAQYIEVPGRDDLWWIGHTDRMLDTIETFVLGESTPPEPERVLAAIMFTALASSTELAAQRADSRWRHLLDQHKTIVRAALGRACGREIKAIDDGFLCIFGAPAHAMRCAIGIRSETTRLGLQVRAGIHAGEIELRDGDVHGFAVNLAAQVVDAAGAGEILISRTVADLVAGGATELTDRGEYPMKGLTEPMRLFAVR